MTTIKKATLSGVAVLAVAGLALGVAPAANADPSTSNRDIVAVGSDTIQDVSNGFGNVIGTFGSYDAVGSATISPRGTAFARPNGSSNGLRALRASANPGAFSWQGANIAGQVDVARSSSGFSQAASSDLAYVPFAIDAVTYATSSLTAVPNGIRLGGSVGEDSDGDGVRDLTLKNIYGYGSGTVTLEDSLDNAYTVGADGSGANIVPFLPQAGSGTRTFFQETLLGTGTSAAPLSGRVTDSYSNGSTTVSVQEHNGLVTADVPNALVPFSIAQWIAQGNNISGVVNRRAGAVLRSVRDQNGNVVAPYTGTAGNEVLNPGFVITRPVYYVAQTSRLTSTDPADAALQRFLRGAAGLGAASNTVQSTSTTPSTEWIGSNTNTITKYGFGLLPNTGATGNIGVMSGYRAYNSFS